GGRPGRPAGQAGAHVDTGGGEVGLDPPGLTRPTAGEGRDLVGGVERARGVADAVRPWRAGRTAAGARVAVGERREDAGRGPVLHGLRVPGVVDVRAPRVVHHVGGEVGARVPAVQVGR